MTFVRGLLFVSLSLSLSLALSLSLTPSNGVVKIPVEAVERPLQLAVVHAVDEPQEVRLGHIRAGVERGLPSVRRSVGRSVGLLVGRLVGSVGRFVG